MTDLAFADIDESVFDASAYDLNIPKMDGHKATNLDIRFSGSGSLTGLPRTTSRCSRRRGLGTRSD
jgi:hypothetical protein